ncbi:hypothetical protein C922_05659, partial [Plasmodium inui San Antonio 1]
GKTERTKDAINKEPTSKSLFLTIQKSNERKGANPYATIKFMFSRLIITL